MAARAPARASAVAPAYRSSGMPTPHGSTSSSALLGASGCAGHSDCTSCLEAADDRCFWCYESESCTAFASPSLAGGLSGIDPFGGCSDWTLISEQCKCRPYADCGECARAAHPTCLWVEDTTLTTTIRYVPPRGGEAQQTSGTTDLGGQCVDGSGLGASQLEGNRTVFASDLLGSVSVAYELSPGRWFWLQCGMSGAGTAVLLLLALLAGVALLVVTVASLVCCWRLYRREGYESVK